MTGRNESHPVQQFTNAHLYLYSLHVSCGPEFKILAGLFFYVCTVQYSVHCSPNLSSLGGSRAAH